MAILSRANQRKLGLEVRRARLLAGFTQSQLAREIPLSQAMMSDIERGRKGVKKEHLARIDDVLITNGRLLRLWGALHSQPAAQRWTLSSLTLEQAASEIREYQLSTVAGLAQIEDYALVTLRAEYPDRQKRELAEQLRVRMDRQSILFTEPGTRYLLVLDENALRRPIGGRAVMARQLDHLLGLSARSNVVLQIIPMDTEQHPALSEGFKIFTIPDRGEVLYLETRLSGGPVDHPDSVSHYTRLFEDLRGAALSVPASRALLTAIRAGLG
ncbi:helix-turn-helix domain-containing protein [Nocardiopsis ansamitocini]|uniref:Transcriptional regulator n=1 Tax=Nocardiopsis ansamitocini TaxID=1670832 RepID=A0A9W6P4K3_9ACTN|nr:helix-turn-helix transcriptional regulator [Nocardiopsis ansamitocini]GLU46971.1 transcriptional regulator [Nocardiopsis ansamitocini]